jgi:hypothetical protein
MTRTLVVGTPVRQERGWRVPSGLMTYFVERVDGRWRCTCPSMRWRHHTLPDGVCKHIKAVFALHGYGR